MKKIILITLMMILTHKTHAEQNEIVIDLRALNLPDSVTVESTKLDYTDEVLQKIRLQPAPGVEGVRKTELPNSPAPQVYSTARVIQKALEDAALLPIGEKISHFENSVKKVLATSGTRRHELIARMTLNRAVDTMNTVLPIAGNNPDEVARFVANFYTEAFKLALGFTTNQMHIQSVITFDEFYKNNLYIAEYGRMFFTLMYRFSMNANISDSSKSVLMIKGLGYLGWDLKLDLRAREQMVRETLADIYTLQKEDRNLNSILASMDQGYEPTQSDVNKLRGKIFKILETLPSVISSIQSVQFARP
jgi:hypothetical protein